MTTTKTPPSKDSAENSTVNKLGKPSASYSVTLRLKIKNLPGMLGKITSRIGEVGGDIGAIDIAGFDKDHIIRDVTVNVRDERHGEDLVTQIENIGDVQVVNVSDRTFLMHLGGKIRVTNKVPLTTRDDLSMAYTPRCSSGLHGHPR